MKKIRIAGLAMAALLITSTVASAQVCAVGLIVAGFYISATENRELTSKEAMTCGILLDKQAEKPAHKKRVARRAKPTG
jgi:hypothetical protein